MTTRHYDVEALNRPGADPTEPPVWVLAMMSDGKAGRATLGGFAGEHLADGPVATIELRGRLPYGCHGCWVGPSPKG